MAVSEEKIRQNSRLELDLIPIRAAIGHGEVVMRDFAEQVSTCYTLLIRAKVSCYHDLLSVVLEDAQLHEVYLMASLFE